MSQRERTWKQSSYCETSACVEVAIGDDGTVAVRDSKLGVASSAQALSFDAAAWRVFTGVLRGDSQFVR